MYHDIRPGKTWYDTDGKRIHAHGGSIIVADGVYYWYGENKEGVTGYATGERAPAWHHGVCMYSSRDLCNWKNEGIIMRESDDPEDPFYPDNIMDRPHIIYCEKTGKYQMWSKCTGKDFNAAFFAICESECVTGPYRYVRKEPCTPYHVGDFDLVKEDGRAYAIFENPHDKMICATLNDTYDGLTGEMTEHLPRPFPPFTREAPAYFRRGEDRFLLTSGTTGYFPNPSEVCRISSFHGAWEDLGDPCIDDTAENSFCAQFSSVFHHPEIPDLYIALGDRWLTDLSYKMPDIRDAYRQLFDPAIGKLPEGFRFEDYSDCNTGEATYVWLPIRFREDGTPYIEWVDRWSPEDFRKTDGETAK
ncbi:MAG: family 43 glycosylhydrolase [Eubacteriales bacterium]